MTSGINDLFDDEDSEIEKPTLSGVFDDEDDVVDDDFDTRRLNQSISSGSYREDGENTPRELIDLPTQPAVQETRRGPVSKMGSKLPWAVTAIIIAVVVAAILIVVGYNAMKTKEIADPPMKNPSVNSAQQPLGGSTATNGSTGDNGSTNNNDQSANVNVPRGGKYVRYEVKGDPSLTSASVTWFDGKGSSRSNLGVDLPWSQPVGRDKDVQSAVAVNTKGSGTVTCTILDKNNKILSQRSSSGSNPTVQCSSR